MESRAKLFGHPIHPMLVVFPLGLLITAVLFDLGYLVGNREHYATLGFYNIAGGIVGGLLAAIFGLRDWLAIPQNTRAKRIGALHGAGNVVVLLLFAVSLVMRYDDPVHAPSALAFTLEVIGIGIAAFTGWLGGELVDRLGVGVYEGANLNSPSSLSREPAATRTGSR